MSRPYLYHYTGAFSRSYELPQAIARSELDRPGFEITSTAATWEHFAVNPDTIVVITNVRLSSNRIYVHVRATSNTDAPAKNWSAQIMEAIKKSKMVSFD
jgi:hypothetical protein